ncbi:hypothetical protein K4A83_16475 [Spirulina subsalsa FACHB-351]|uniref:MORN repeat-containing protein n=1 Tax=Spirulina subsalsa FACHB-351 TaxID=234711 RepID=A0ABT3L8L4_9CYAN|nr:hypothetical protein [Spirulina subsalsa]MCW6037856.1 hypothetical protein [Spirulina subsalsa FACHB-351]
MSKISAFGTVYIMGDIWTKLAKTLFITSGLPLLGLVTMAKPAIAQAIITLPNGIRCEGQFNGFTGRGICEYPEGYYRGTIVNGQRQGQGVFYFSEGNGGGDDNLATIYEGQFSNDRPNGRGRFIYGNDDRYDGEVLNGIPHGTGQFTFRSLETENFLFVVNNNLITMENVDKRDSRYFGGVRNGRPEGRGTFVYGICQAYGAELRCLRYDGMFRNGVPHGQGTMTTPACLVRGGQVVCSRFTGNFYRGQPNGPGQIITANGDRCQGEFNDFTFTGRGTCTYTNGDRYSGELRFGAPHGIGVATYANGQSYRGEFVFGAPRGISRAR